MLPLVALVKMLLRVDEVARDANLVVLRLCPRLVAKVVMLACPPCDKVPEEKADRLMQLPFDVGTGRPKDAAAETGTVLAKVDSLMPLPFAMGIELPAEPAADTEMMPKEDALGSAMV